MKKIMLISLYAMTVCATAQIDNTAVSDSVKASNIPIITIKGRDFSNIIFENKPLDFYNFQQYLREKSGVFIKDGSGMMLSSLRIAGTTPAQTAVVWNGLRINSPTNGQIDVNLLPNGLFGATLVEGGSAQFGSASMAASLLIGSVQSKEKLIVHQQIGSFGAFQGMALVRFQNSKIKQSVGFQYNTAKNNYTFHNRALANGPLDTLHNAEGSIVHLTHSLNTDFKRNYSLSTAFWFTKAERNIPVSIIEAKKSGSSQLDETYRGNVGISKQLKRLRIAANNSLSIENLTFIDQDLGINKYKTYCLLNEVQAHFKLSKKLALKTGIFNENTGTLFAFVDKEKVRINTVATYVTVQHSVKNWSNDLTINQSFNSLGYAPFTAQLNLKYCKKYWCFGSVSANNFRAPTINDLYWPIWGNINLKPEMGWKQSVYIQYKRALSKSLYADLKLSSSLMVLRNQVVWTFENAVWRPINIDSTIHFNTQLNYTVKKYFAKWSIGIEGNTNFTRAAKQGMHQIDDKQLFYTPYFMSNNVLTIQYHHFRLFVRNQYQGYVYADPENSIVIPAFSVWSVTLEKSMKIKKVDWSIYVSINNLTNKYYEITLWRPMPPRNFQLGIKLKI